MKMQRRRFLGLGAGAIALVSAPYVSRGDSYPSRPIRLVVPFPPGGVFDIVGRPWADKVGKSLGTVYVDNQPGAGGSLGAQVVSRLAPDGYALLLGTSTINLAESLMRKQPLLDPDKDLTPISMVAITCFGIGVNPSLPVHSLKELIDYVKANPGKMAYASSSPGTMNHLTGEMFKSLTDIADLPPIPYRGAGPALLDTVAGQVPMVVAAMTSQVVEFHRSGKLRILAETHTTRLPAAPDIPTAVEAGVPGLVTDQVIGVFGPAGMPKEIVARIDDANQKALADSAYRQSLIDAAVVPIPNWGADRFNQFMQEDYARWTPLVKKLGITI